MKKSVPGEFEIEWVIERMDSLYAFSIALGDCRDLGEMGMARAPSGR